MATKRKSFSEFGRTQAKVTACEVCGKEVAGYVSITIGKSSAQKNPGTGRGLGSMVAKETIKACELHAVDLFEELLAMAQDATNSRPRSAAA